MRNEEIINFYFSYQLFPPLALLLITSYLSKTPGW
jgi:hypothetical protein